MKIGARWALDQLEKALSIGGDTVTLPRAVAEDCLTLLRLAARQDDGDGVVLVLVLKKPATSDEEPDGG